MVPKYSSPDEPALSLRPQITQRKEGSAAANRGREPTGIHDSGFLPQNANLEAELLRQSDHFVEDVAVGHSHVVRQIVSH
jgi:hypothetical protein